LHVFSDLAGLVESASAANAKELSVSTSQETKSNMNASPKRRAAIYEKRFIFSLK
jgi:hypothetical protein